MKKIQLTKKSNTSQANSRAERRIYSSTERVVDSVPCPPAHLLTIKEIFGNSGLWDMVFADIDRWMWGLGFFFKINRIWESCYNIWKPKDDWNSMRHWLLLFEGESWQHGNRICSKLVRQWSSSGIFMDNSLTWHVEFFLFLFLLMGDFHSVENVRKRRRCVFESVCRTMHPSWMSHSP